VTAWYVYTGAVFFLTLKNNYMSVEKTDSIKEVTKALSVFHTKIGKINKDAKNPYFNSAYASLSAILEAIKQPLQDAGLVFTQMPCGRR
jgi:hypothetical protein